MQNKSDKRSKYADKSSNHGSIEPHVINSTESVPTSVTKPNKNKALKKNGAIRGASYNNGDNY